MTRSRLLLLVLGILGIVYSLLATWFYVANWTSLLHLMQGSLLMSVLVRNAWAGIVLAPITIVVALLRLKAVYSILIIFVFAVFISSSVFAFSPFNFGEFMGLAINLLPTLALQIPVYLFTLLLARLVHRLISTRADASGC